MSFAVVSFSRQTYLHNHEGFGVVRSYSRDVSVSVGTTSTFSFETKSTFAESNGKTNCITVIIVKSDKNIWSEALRIASIHGIHDIVYHLLHAHPRGSFNDAIPTFIDKVEDGIIRGVLLGNIV